MRERWLLAALFLLTASSAGAIGQPRYILDRPAAGAFPILHASICVDAADWPGVVRAANDLQADIERVTGVKPPIVHEPPGAGPAIVIGTIGKSKLLDGFSMA